MDNVLDFSTRRSPARASETVGEIESQVGTLFNETFTTTLASCEDALQQRAERATNGNLQAHYFDDLRLFRENLGSANAHFRAACRVAFRHYRGEPAHAESALDAAAEMKLVAHDDLELDLAMFRIGKRCDEAAPRLRHQVQRRFQVLLGLAEDTPSPLCGIGIARMCRAGINALDLGLEARLIVLKRLELRFAEIAESALERANQILAAHGVLPNLRATPVRPGPAPTISRHGSTAIQSSVVAVASEPAPDNAAAQAADINEVVAQVAQWLARQTPEEFATVVAAASTSTAPKAAEPAEATATASNELDAARERRRVEIAERRAAEIERARVQRVAAERSTDSVIAAVVAQPHVPASIRELLQGPLRRHLEIVYARRGEASTEWRSARKLVNDIAWSLDPETFRVERAHWSEVYPGIIQTLRDALSAAGVQDHQAARIVSEFSGRCEELLAAAKVSDLASAVAETAGVTASEAGSEKPDAPSFADALARVRRYVTGQWVEMIDDQGLTQRAKLVWTSAMTGRCLFVNGSGKLVADRPHARIAADVLAGSFRELEGMASA